MLRTYSPRFSPAPLHSATSGSSPQKKICLFCPSCEGWPLIIALLGCPFLLIQSSWHVQWYWGGCYAGRSWTCAVAALIASPKSQTWSMTASSVTCWPPKTRSSLFMWSPAMRRTGLSMKWPKYTESWTEQEECPASRWVAGAWREKVGVNFPAGYLSIHLFLSSGVQSGYPGNRK